MVGKERNGARRLQGAASVSAPHLANGGTEFISWKVLKRRRGMGRLANQDANSRKSCVGPAVNTSFCLMPLDSKIGSAGESRCIDLPVAVQAIRWHPRP